MTDQISEARRTELLDNAITHEVMSGATLVSRAGFQAVLEVSDPGNPALTNNVLHALLTIFTCGFWLLVWPMVAGSNAAKRRKGWAARYTVQVDENGQTWTLGQGGADWKPLG